MSWKFAIQIGLMSIAVFVSGANVVVAQQFIAERAADARTATREGNGRFAKIEQTIAQNPGKENIGLAVGKEEEIDLSGDWINDAKKDEPLFHLPLKTFRLEKTPLGTFIVPGLDTRARVLIVKEEPRYISHSGVQLATGKVERDPKTGTVISIRWSVGTTWTRSATPFAKELDIDLVGDWINDAKKDEPLFHLPLKTFRLEKTPQGTFIVPGLDTRARVEIVKVEVVKNEPRYISHSGAQLATGKVERDPKTGTVISIRWSVGTTWTRSATPFAKELDIDLVGDWINDAKKDEPLFHLPLKTFRLEKTPQGTFIVPGLDTRARVEIVKVEVVKNEPRYISHAGVTLATGKVERDPKTGVVIRIQWSVGTTWTRANTTAGDFGTQPRPNGALIFEDRFDTDDPITDPVLNPAIMSFENKKGIGKLVTTFRGVAGVIYSKQSAKDFAAEYEFESPEPGPNSSFGFFFRGELLPGPGQRIPNYYLLLVDPTAQRGSMACWQKEWSFPLAFTLKQGLLDDKKPNRVRLEALGDNFRVFINGTFVGQVNDAKISGTGIFGFMVYANKEEKNTVHFSNLRVYALSEKQAELKKEIEPLEKRDEQAKAEAEAAFRKAQDRFERSAKLYRDGAISEAEYNADRLARDAARAQLDRFGAGNLKEQPDLSGRWTESFSFKDLSGEFLWTLQRRPDGRYDVEGTVKGECIVAGKADGFYIEKMTTVATVVDSTLKFEWKGKEHSGSCEWKLDALIENTKAWAGRGSGRSLANIYGAKFEFESKVHRQDGAAPPIPKTEVKTTRINLSGRWEDRDNSLVVVLQRRADGLYDVQHYGIKQFGNDPSGKAIGREIGDTLKIDFDTGGRFRSTKGHGTWSLNARRTLAEGILEIRADGEEKEGSRNRSVLTRLDAVPPPEPIVEPNRDQKP